jgi:hypothetical protein
MNNKIRHAAKIVKDNALPIAACAAVFAVTYVTARHLINTNEEVETVAQLIPNSWFEKLNEEGGAYLIQSSLGDFLLTKSNI